MGLMSWLRGGKRKTGTRSSDQNLLADILDPFGPYAPYLKRKSLYLTAYRPLLNLLLLYTR
jgi:hypothetical protein